MRIVQTFWTAGKSPLEESFGWRHPEYNLMSWALSCLSLREHYDEVVLYTDSLGKEILIDTLHLPYTDVQVVFDDFPCLPQHWAMAKVKTYSLQTEPFLHVDGDVYIPNALPDVLLECPLVAQNKEIGTNYYKDMMQRVCKNPNIVLPEYIRKALAEDSISSYNMGVFGGHDLQFIQRYCQEVFDFMNLNGMNDPHNPNSNTECNVFFEQVIFAAMADRDFANVDKVIEHDIYDQGYTADEFCDLYNFMDRPLHHLLGGHKRNEEVEDLLYRRIITKYTALYKKIATICSRRYDRYPSNSKSSVFDYEYRKAISLNNVSKEIDGNQIAELNRAIVVYHKQSTCYVVVPSILYSRQRTVIIRELGKNAISILDTGKRKVGKLKKELLMTLSENMANKADIYIQDEIKYLFYNGIVIIS